MPYEIERKFLIKKLPENLEQFSFHIIEQAYLTCDPTIRVRREDDRYYMTYKGSGLMVHEEYNLPLTEEAYETLSSKSDGNVIRKKRYLIPYQNHTIELDIFSEPFAPLIIAEVEFESKDEADAFTPPEWFDKDVTGDREYYNSNLSRKMF